MLIIENLIMAFSSLLSNKMRALLTMLGIIIGIASVIAIMTVGNSISMSVAANMESMGANNITVGLQQKSTEEQVSESGARFEGGTRGRTIREEDLITEEMLEELAVAYQQQIAGISLSVSSGNGTAEKGKLYANVSVTGGNEGYFQLNELTINAGRGLTETDQEKGGKVAVVSDKLVENLYEGNAQSAIGAMVEVSINNRYYTYTIVGVYEYQAEAASFSTDSEEDITTQLYIPLKAAQAQNHSAKGYEQFTVATESGVDTEAFMEQLEHFFDRYYRKNQDYQISAFSMETMLSSMTDMLSTISLAIAVIAGISLLVGGIGVMNIMLVSITERTREIGTRKALGATNGSIRLQFIMEAVVICLSGGFMGILSGIGIGAVLAGVMGYEAKASMAGILAAVSFSVALGIFFGYYPAEKAARMNPIEALRYE